MTLFFTILERKRDREGEREAGNRTKAIKAAIALQVKSARCQLSYKRQERTSIHPARKEVRGSLTLQLTTLCLWI